eukprot:4986795-Amphidinium_carterae.1
MGIFSSGKTPRMCTRAVLSLPCCTCSGVLSDIELAGGSTGASEPWIPPPGVDADDEEGVQR